MTRRNPPIDPRIEPYLRQGPPAEEIAENAIEAEPDIENVLAMLERVQNERSRWNDGHDLDDNYQELREAATAALLDGPRYFIAEDGRKWVAVRQQSEPIDVDEQLLAELDPEMYEAVAPRKLDKELFKRAVKRGEEHGISAEVFLAVTKLKPNAPFVKFLPLDVAD